MEIQFLGATHTVTGSKFLLKAEKKVMIDCGLFQGLKDLRLRNRKPLPIDPKAIDAVVLTHAHLDHSGYLPVLVKNGFRGKVYATPMTIGLTKILLLDSGHLQEEEAKYANKHGYSKHKPALPLYTRQEAEAVFEYFKAIPFYQEFSIGDLKVQFQRAGHIFGAASVIVKNKDTSLVFSGDLGGKHRGPCVLPPDKLGVADYLVIESTYGDRLHEDWDPKNRLAEIINRVVGRGGTLIIPSFAVGRTQTLLYYLYRLHKEGTIPSIPIFLDSPMAQDVTDLVLEDSNKSCLAKSDCQQLSEIAHYVTNVAESKELDQQVFPKIIVSASGMATGGRVLHHIKALAGDKRNAILFVGHQARGTRGEAMVHGKTEIKMFGRMVPINAEVISLNTFSAHADYQEMLTWISTLKKPPKKVFIVHGEEQGALALKERIQNTLGWSCSVPEYLAKEQLL